jgi:hypothetical protein
MGAAARPPEFEPMLAVFEMVDGRPGVRSPREWGKIAPHRIGLLCESDPVAPGQVTVNLFWRHRGQDNKPQLCPVSMALDFSSAGNQGRDADSSRKKLIWSNGGSPKTA